MKVKATLAIPFIVFLVGTVFFLLAKYEAGYSFVTMSFFLLSCFAYLIGRIFDRTRLQQYNMRSADGFTTLKDMLDSPIDLVYLLEVKEKEYIISSVNKSFLKSVAMTRRQVIGAKAEKLLGMKIVEKCDEVIEKKTSIDFLTMVDFSQHEVQLDTSIHPIQYANGEPRFLVCVSKIISGKRQAEELIKETEDHFQFITENATDIIVKLAADSTFLYVSPIVEKMIGVKPKDLLFVSSPFDFVHPDDRSHCKKQFRKMIQSDEIVTFTYRVIKPNGGTIWLESKGQRILNSGVTELICISRDATERVRLEQRLLEANERLEYLSYVDELTSVGNRRKLDMTLKKLSEERRRCLFHLSVLMFDIDFFKEFNDMYGHLNGDTCLKSLAGVVRTISEEFGAELFRYGGEEFIILFAHTSEEEISQLGECILKAVRMLKIPHATSSVAEVVTISIGAYTIIDHSNHFDPNSIIDFADKALYQAKNSGKNQMKFYEPLSLHT